MQFLPHLLRDSADDAIRAGVKCHPRPDHHAQRFGLVVCALDHDFAEDRLVPYGVYDVVRNEALVLLAMGADTSDLACDAVRRWWYRRP